MATDTAPVQTFAPLPQPLTPERVKQLTQELQIYHRNAVGQYPMHIGPQYRAGRDAYMRAALGAMLVVLVCELAGEAARDQVLQALTAVEG